MATREDRRGPLALADGDLDTLAIGNESGLAVDETWEAVAPVQNRDEFHGAEGGG